MKQTEQAELVPANSGPMEIIPQSPLALAIQAGCTDVAIMRELVQLDREVQADRARREFCEAFAAMQAEIPAIEKGEAVDFTSANGRTHYRFANLARIDAAVKPVLARHGFAKVYGFEDKPNLVRVTCLITHRSGHAQHTAMDVPYDATGNKNEIQARGSAAQYGMRYTLIGALGLTTCDEDTDGGEPAAAVTEAQARYIQDAVDAGYINGARMLKTYAVGSVEELPAAKFGEIKAIIAERAKEAGK